MLVHHCTKDTYHLVVTEVPGSSSMSRYVPPVTLFSTNINGPYTVRLVIPTSTLTFGVSLCHSKVSSGRSLPHMITVAVHHPTDVERSLIAEENVPALQPHRGRNTLPILQHNPLLPVCVVSGYGRLSFLFQCEM